MGLHHGMSGHIFKNISLIYHGGMLYKDFNPEEGDCMFLWNNGNYMASHP
jgi:hypothetical protein